MREPQPPFRLGQILVERTAASTYVLCHREDASTARSGFALYRAAEDAAEIARFDEAGKYRPLKTAPTLRHGWQLDLDTLDAVRLALDLFYPGRLAAYAAWREERLVVTPLRTTLERQTGMYRVAAQISDTAADELVGRLCRSDGGCLRTILWSRDATGALASTHLPADKFDPACDQTGRGERTLPLLCQEACTLLVAEARQVVKNSRPA